VVSELQAAAAERVADLLFDSDELHRDFGVN